ncbi:MAG: sugar transferase [Candidatus Sericytochromatia bacterium]|nr:sugar transferase [Candidatus Sericytochromatia bacterium]
MLIVLSPFLLFVSLLIKIFDPGPILFLQDRVGKDQINFKIFKFRTMIVNADKLGSVLTQSNDPRITKLGKFLRHSSIDELPQLINIFRGEMSLVGPRPEVPVIVKTYNDIQRGVFKVRPGITGWAQIHGRDELTIEQKSIYDLEYTERISFMLDLKIFILTFPVLISSKGIN